jgi:DNA-binding response OmpR family regulator
MDRARILIVDDDPDITEAMKVVLENADYGVDSANDSEQAMELVKSTRPDLIIMDIMMNTLREGFLLSRG